MSLKTVCEVVIESCIIVPLTVLERCMRAPVVVHESSMRVPLFILGKSLDSARLAYMTFLLANANRNGSCIFNSVIMGAMCMRVP